MAVSCFGAVYNAAAAHKLQIPLGINLIAAKNAAILVLLPQRL